MGKVRAPFLGTRYLISEYTPKYSLIRQEFDRYYEFLINYVDDLQKQGKYVGGTDRYFNAFYMTIKSVVDEIIRGLGRYRIYDITVQKLLSNSGYYQLKNICLEAEHQLSLYAEEIDREYQQRARAYAQNASSKITGQGFGIVTNSIATMLFYDHMEEKTIREQREMAQQEYDYNINALTAELKRTYDKKSNTYLAAKYYPRCKTAINEMINSMFQIYMKRLANTGAVEFQDYLKYDFVQSENILSNINTVYDKRSLLERAFSVCPFNAHIYKTLIDDHIFDSDSFKTATWLKLNNSLTPIVENYCTGEKTKYSSLSDAIKVWVILSGMSEAEAYSKAYSGEIKEIKKSIASLIDSFKNVENCRDWTFRYVTPDFNKLLLLSTSEIAARVDLAISQIVDLKLLTFLSEKGAIAVKYSISGALKDSASVIHEIRTQLINAIVNLRDSIKGNIRRLKSQRVQLQNEIASLDDKIDYVRNAERMEINALKQEFIDTGTFDFSKKRTLNNRIEKARENAKSVIDQILDEINALYDQIAIIDNKLEELY